MAVLNRIQVKGFKSIREMDLELRPINVLIGANGSGKSNFLSVFRLLHEIVHYNLREFVARSGGANTLLHWNVLRNEEMFLQVRFEKFGYEARLIPTLNHSLVFRDERVDDPTFTFLRPLEGLEADVAPETTLHYNTNTYQADLAKGVIDSFRNFRVYHFNDVGGRAGITASVNVNDNIMLRPDGSNLAAMLYLFKERYSHHYRRIVETIQLAAPFFKEFELQPNRLNPESILLEWHRRGLEWRQADPNWRQTDTDTYFNTGMLSDGTLRFMCLTVLLMQPTPPPLIIIDEPELGLHPYGETLVASMVKSVAARGHQIIVSTQSARLVDEFNPEDIVVAEWEDNQSVFKRQSTQELKEWLEDYSLGQLWEKNILGGTP